MRRLIIGTILCLNAFRGEASTPCPTFTSAFSPDVFRQGSDATNVACQSVQANGSPLIAAVFSKGHGGRIVLLRPNADGSSGTLLSAPRENMGDEFVSIDALDRNGESQLVVTFRAARGSGVQTVWVYSVRNQRLTLISPSTREDGPLTDPEFLDLDGSGVIGVIDRKLDVEADPDDSTGVSRLVTPVVSLYTWQDGKYTKSTSTQMLFAGSFVRDKGTPITDTDYFPAVQNVAATIMLLNGRPNYPDEACESGDVVVNGQQVFSSSDFKRRAYVAASTAQILTDNTINVTLRGTPGCHAFILVKNVR